MLFILHLDVGINSEKKMYLNIRDGVVRFFTAVRERERVGPKSPPDVQYLCICVAEC